MEFKLPPLPSTLAEVLQVLAREAPVPDNQHLVEIIQRDPAVSLYVLRQANSAYYGLQRDVAEIDRAVTLLGLKRVCNLVLSAGLKQAFTYLEDTAARQIYEHVIQVSVATAAYAQALAKHLNFTKTDTAFTAGLLVRLGRLVFLYSAPARYVPLWHTPGTSLFTPPALETERLAFGIDHLQIGASTMRAWELPEELAGVISHLHMPETIGEISLEMLTKVVAASSMFAETLFDATPVASRLTGGRPEGRSDVLNGLAEVREADPLELATFLASQRRPVFQFAKSILCDA